MDTSY